MSIHKKDIESLLEAFTAVHSKGNMKAAGELIPHLVRSLVRYLETSLGIEQAAEPCCDGTLPPEDKAFALAATVSSLKENGNATIKTDIGDVSLSASKEAIESAAELGVDVAKEIAVAMVAEIEKEGATEVTAVTTKIEDEVDAEEKAEAKPAKKAPAKKG